MKAVVRKWGNSAAVRIPSSTLKAVRLDIDDPVELREESGRIVIEPLEHKEFSLSALLKRITRDNLHDEADFGAPVGKENW